MGKLTAFCAVLLLSFQAQAAILADKDGRLYRFIDPPPHWFKRPTLGEVRVFVWPRTSVHDACYQAIGKTKQRACAIVKDGVCSIYLANDLPVELDRYLRHHELAHCHGWPPWHPTY